MNINPLLCTDVYKMGHMEQYPPGTSKIYSYLTTRSNKIYDKTIFYGLQYYLKQYLCKPIRPWHVREFLEVRKAILGIDLDTNILNRLTALPNLGFIPLEVKALPEGSKVEKFNALMTVTNTHPDYAFLVGFFESLLLKIWYTSTVASHSHEYFKIAEKYAMKTCENTDHVPFAVHDFGYRGCSSEETAALGGSAHLLNFLGTDTVHAVKFAKEFYNATQPIGLSVPASEHCVMCVHGKDGEFDAFKRMLDIYPDDAIVSIVSDTYNLWHVLTDFVPRLKDQILARKGKVVFRPDSGEPIDIICGKSMTSHQEERYQPSPQEKGVLELLDEVFGHTTNNLGYKILNPKVGVIYGDGMFLKRYIDMLERMKNQGWASSNLVIGVGGLLLQHHNRDDLGFAFKATHCIVDGEEKEVYKDPFTDPGKKSHKGLMRVVYKNGEYVTYDQQTKDQEATGLLKTVYRDGVLFSPHLNYFGRIRHRIKHENHYQ